MVQKEPIIIVIFIDGLSPLQRPQDHAGHFFNALPAIPNVRTAVLLARNGAFVRGHCKHMFFSSSLPLVPCRSIATVCTMPSRLEPPLLFLRGRRESKKERTPKYSIASEKIHRSMLLTKQPTSPAPYVT